MNSRTYVSSSGGRAFTEVSSTVESDTVATRTLALKPYLAPISISKVGIVGVEGGDFSEYGV